MTQNFGATGTSAAIVTSLTDEIMVDDPTRGNRFKPCTHTKILQYAVASTQDSYRNGGGPVTTWSGPNAYWHNWEHQPPTYNPGIIGVSWPRTEAQLYADAKDRFYNTNDVDSLLNIVESPQLVSSFQSLAKTLENESTLRALRNRFKATSAKQKSFKTKAIIKNVIQKSKGVSGAYLAYSFGLAPLISDMKKVQSSLRTLSADMRKARQNEGKPITVRVSQQGTGMNLGSQGHVPGTGLTLYLNQLQQPVMVCCVKGTRTTKYNSEAFSKASYLLNRFGSGGPASYVWERIPYSFIVDWFVDLRDVTNSLDNLLTGNSKKITDACLSSKVNWGVGYVHRNANIAPYADQDYEGRVMCGSEYQQYHRKLLPSGLLVLRKGKLGEKKLSLLAALLHQKVANLILKALS